MLLKYWLFNLYCYDDLCVCVYITGVMCSYTHTYIVRKKKAETFCYYVSIKNMNNVIKDPIKGFDMFWSMGQIGSTMVSVCVPFGNWNTSWANQL